MIQIRKIILNLGSSFLSQHMSSHKKLWQIEDTLWLEGYLWNHALTSFLQPPVPGSLPHENSVEQRNHRARGQRHWKWIHCSHVFHFFYSLKNSGLLSQSNRICSKTYYWSVSIKCCFSHFWSFLKWWSTKCDVTSKQCHVKLWTYISSETFEYNQWWVDYKLIPLIVRIFLSVTLFDTCPICHECLDSRPCFLCLPSNISFRKPWWHQSSERFLIKFFLRQLNSLISVICSHQQCHSREKEAIRMWDALLLSTHSRRDVAAAVFIINRYKNGKRQMKEEDAYCHNHKNWYRRCQPFSFSVHLPSAVKWS